MMSLEKHVFVIDIKRLLFEVWEGWGRVWQWSSSIHINIDIVFIMKCYNIMYLKDYYLRWVADQL